MLRHNGNLLLHRPGFLVKSDIFRLLLSAHIDVIGAVCGIYNAGIDAVSLVF